MVRNTKHHCRKEDLQKMEDVLYEVLSSYNWRSDFNSIMQEFFTKAERKMFAKRVFIMYLLYKKVPYNDISRALKSSTSTISRYALLLSDDKLKLKKVFARIERKERLINMFDDVFCNAFVYPGLYKNHWAIYREYKKRKMKRVTSGI